MQDVLVGNLSHLIEAVQHSFDTFYTQEQNASLTPLGDNQYCNVQLE